MPNFSDVLADRWVYNGVQIERYSASLQAKMDALLKKLRVDLSKALSDPDALTTFKSRRFKAMLSEVARKIGETYDQMDSYSKNAYSKLYAQQGEHAITMLNRAMGADVFQPFVISDALAASAVSEVLIEGAPSAEWWSRRADIMLNDFADNVREGMTRGESLTEIRDRVLGKTDMRKKSVLEKSVIRNARRGVEALVRTSVHTITSAAHMAAYEANSDIIKGVQWISTLDTRTCARCGALDGEQWKLADRNHPFTPLHWACRCMLIPVLKSFAEMAREEGGNVEWAKRLDNIPEGTRASMDGQVAASLHYEDWLSRQSVEIQKDVLGAGRYSLWSKGKLGLADMLDQRGNPIPLTRLNTGA